MVSSLPLVQQRFRLLNSESSTAIFAAWAFLSLDLPRSTLLDVTDSLALPAFKPEKSLTFAYRNAHPRFDYSSIGARNVLVAADHLTDCSPYSNSTTQRSLRLLPNHSYLISRHHSVSSYPPSPCSTSRRGSSSHRHRRRADFAHACIRCRRSIMASRSR